jgi:hypothetical protein
MKILIVYYSLYGDVFSWHKLSKKVSSRLKEPKCHSVAWSQPAQNFRYLEQEVCHDLAAVGFVEHLMSSSGKL